MNSVVVSAIIGLCFAAVMEILACMKILKGEWRGAAQGFVAAGFFFSLSLSLLLFLADEMKNSLSSYVIAGVVVGLGLGLLNVLYHAPVIVAGRSSHPNVGAILALNLLLGWSFFGWVGALVWALVRKNDARAVTYVRPSNAIADDGRQACWQCGRRVAPGFLCSDGRCQQCYKPSWAS